MNPPFSQDDFFRILIDYNTGIWPVQIILAGLAMVVLIVSIRSEEWTDRLVSAVLGVLWIWMGVAYHWIYFTEINPAAWVFGGAFAVEGLVFVYLALKREPLQYRPRWDGFGLIGATFIGYGLVLYPILSSAFGHTYPAQPTFGLPCPTTIFTVGVLLWAAPRIHPAILAIPVLWSLVGMNAAWLFGVVEDFALPVAGILGGVLILLKNRRSITFT
ncbi:MAG: DUF6064 family protein [Candidatus Latescibacterota bacterium]|jgi:hypothetical protein